MTTPMNDGEQPPESRSAAFSDGHQFGPESPVASPAFQQQAAQLNSGGPAKVRYTGSGLSMSAEQASATLGGALSTQNGSASDTYNAEKFQGGGQQ